jgi:hypothetical protein
MLALLMYVIHFHPWISNFLRLKTCGGGRKKTLPQIWDSFYDWNKISERTT